MKKISLIFCLTIFCLISFSQVKGTFKDFRDGKVYKTVKIGTQTWLAENLAFKPDSGNYWAYKNDQNNTAKYGYLYDWKTAKIVIPKGWHLPSDAEWSELINNLGGDSIAGGKLKATIDWQSPNEGATNSTGFSALPAGFRISDFGSCGNLGISAAFWSSAPVDNNTWVRQLDNKFGWVSRTKSHIKNGFSVRCLKNK